LFTLLGTHYLKFNSGVGYLGELGSIGEKDEVI
jgi:hypothetical protein